MKKAIEYQRDIPRMAKILEKLSEAGIPKEDIEFLITYFQQDALWVQSLVEKRKQYELDKN